MIAMTNTPDALTGIEIALLIFVAVFICVTIGALVRRRGHFDHAANIPLDDSTEGATR